MERERYSLNKEWRFHLGDLEQEIKVDHGVIYGTAKAGACQGVPQADYDVSGWQQVDLPHDWSIHLPFSEENVPDWGYKGRGKGWYRRSFALSEEAKEKKIVLGFEGVATRCTVYLNGMEIYHNHSGYTPFEMDVTDIVYFGNVPNTLAVYVDASIWEGWWYEGAGIYRNVWLEVLSKTHIEKDSVFLKPVEEKEGNFETYLEMEVENGTQEEVKAGAICYLTSPDGERKKVWEEKEFLCTPGRKTVKGTFFMEKPALWDIEQPNLYQAEVVLQIGEKIQDRVQTVCGFRSISFSAEKGFFLNHRQVKIFGTCNHEDFGGLGVAVPSNLWTYRIEKLKSMGSNGYRCAHGMAAEELIQACDKMGMLVLAENRNFSTSKEGMEQLEILVKRYRNHPSVIMYSIFNEEPLEGTLQGMRMAKRMAQKIKELDDSRFVTGAMHGGMLEEENAAIAIDVAGVNYQIPVYDPFHQKNPQMPMIATETTSTFSVRGCYEDDNPKHLISSYDHMPADWGNTVRDTWKAIMEREYMSGGFMWTGFDYLGEPTPYTWPSVSSFFGLLDTCGFEKDGFYLAKAIFQKEDVCHLLPHWNHRGKEGEKIRVMSHTNCEEAELLVNGKSYGRQKVDVYTQCQWMVPYEPGIIRLNGYRNGKLVAYEEKETTGSCKKLHLLAWNKEIQANAIDAVLLFVEALDEKGRFVPDCNLKTYITVEGGSLLGSCNGDPNSHEPFDGRERSLFQGKAMFVVRPDTKSGELTVTVQAELPSQKTGFRQELQDTCEKETDTILQEKLTLPVVIPPKTRELESVQEIFLTHWRLSPVYPARPDVQEKTQAYDMNSWQDVYVNKKSGSPKILENAVGKYGIYEINVQIPKEINGHTPELYFYNIWGECEVYINGIVKDTFSYEWAVPHSVKLQKEDCGKANIRILVKSVNEYGAGLNSLVVLR